MFYETLLMLCEEMGISLTTLLTKHLKMSSGNITKWKENKIPRADTLQKIAEFFGVSTDYLLGNADIKKEPTAQIGDKLFGEEAEILKMFRAASPELKAAALAMLEAAERNRLNNNSSSKDK